MSGQDMSILLMFNLAFFANIYTIDTYHVPRERHILHILFHIIEKFMNPR